MRELLSQVGLEPERVRMFNLSAAMAGEFAAAAREMVEAVAALGPSPLRDLAAAPASAEKSEA